MPNAIKNAVITGANRGLGLELCKQLSTGSIYSSVYALCRKTSSDLDVLQSKYPDKMNVVENVDITGDVAGLKQELGNIPIHLLVHNAGAYGPPEALDDPVDMYKSQNLETIDANKMEWAFRLNTVAPLLVTQALAKNLEAAATEADPAKVVIISSAMGSIDDNTSSRHYAYRVSKAAVNMVGKNLSIDLKPKNIAVSLIHPGFVYTGFGGENVERRPGQRDVVESTTGVIQAIESTNLETTGQFFHGNYGEGVKQLPW